MVRYLLCLHNAPFQRTTLQKHFDQQIAQYGQQIIINLVSLFGKDLHLSINVVYVICVCYFC